MGERGVPGKGGLRAAEALFGGVILALGLFIGVETAMLEVAPSVATVGPRLFPAIVATVTTVVGLLLLREALAGRVPTEAPGQVDVLPILLVSAGLIAIILLIERVGWVIAATLLFVAGAAAFGSRRLLLDAVIGVTLALLVFVLFTYGLGLSLPSGLELLFGGDEG